MWTYSSSLWHHKKMSPSLNNVLEIVIKLINYVETSPVKARFFKKLCEGMEVEHTLLLFYFNSKWPSKGNILLRVLNFDKNLTLI